MFVVWTLTQLALAAPPASLTTAASATWQCEQSPEEMQQIVDAAVEKVANELPFFVRGVVRSKLAESATFCPNVQIDANTQEWRSACADGGSFSRSWDGGAQPFTSPQGKPVSSSLQYNEDTVTVAFQGAEGGRTAAYAFHGDRMVLDVEINSPKLPTPFKWQFTYRKQVE